MGNWYNVQSVNENLLVRTYRVSTNVTIEVKHSGATYIALNINKNTNFITNKKAENLDNYSQISIINPTTWSINTQISDTTGVASELINSSANASDYSDIQLNTEYSIAYSTRVWLYGYNREYLGFIIPTNNSTFTVTNSLCKSVRLNAPSVGSLCVISKYIVSTPSGVYRPPYSGKTNQTFNDLYKYPVQGFGDSIIARYLASTFLANNQNRFLTAFSYGGCKSGLIRDEFLDKSNKEGVINLIYLSHNNLPQTKRIVNDIRTMVRSLNNRRFLIVSTPNGTYTTLAATQARLAWQADLDSRLSLIYGDHYLSMHKAAVNGGYDMGNVKLTQSFIQPNDNNVATVDIYVDNVTFMMFRHSGDNASWIPSQELFKIGGYTNEVDDTELFDEYEIISSTIVSGDAGYLTCKLVPNAVKRVTVGASVDNEATSATPAGGAVAINYINYLQILKSNDKYLVEEVGTTATTFREDSVHPGAYGGFCTSEIFSYRLAALNF